MISQELKQLRRGYAKLIKNSPFVVTLSRKPKTGTGSSGQPVEDPFADPVESQVTVRIAHERMTIAKNDSTPVGSSTNLTKYILWEYDVDIQEEDVFPELEGYRVGRPDPLWKFGGIYGNQAPLIEAKS